MTSKELVKQTLENWRFLNMALHAVVSGKKRFVSQYKETEAEDRLMQELNEQE